jgi:hypothetical protein
MVCDESTSRAMISTARTRASPVSISPEYTSTSHETICRSSAARLPAMRGCTTPDYAKDPVLKLSEPYRSLSLLVQFRHTNLPAASLKSAIA